MERQLLPNVQSKSVKSPTQSTSKIKLDPPIINSTFRPFYECENDNNRGKKNKKKTKKFKKNKGKKKKKKNDNTSHKILYFGMQKIYVTYKECNVLTKALRWHDFRAWLQYNLEPYDHQHLDKRKQRELFTIKMQILLNFCTYNVINNHNNTQYYYCLWLQIPQKQNWLQLIINDGHWYTNCTTEPQMMGYTTNISDRDYYFFRIIEGHTTPNNIILLFRCDKGGNCGEVLWLQKGKNVSGTDALAIENALSSALDLRWIYLNDDSKIKYGANTSRSECNLHLKTIRSIAKGESWFSQAFYRPFNCTNWPSQININGTIQTGIEPTIFTQNAAQYKNAVNLIREFTIKKLRKLLIYNTDFNKKNEKKGDNMNNNTCDNNGIYPVMHPSDLNKFDQVLMSMNEYDPYYEKYGKPKRLLYENKDNGINIEYCSPDEISIDSDDDDVKLIHDFKREKLLENKRICVVRRWHRRRIKIKLDENNASEYIHNKQIIEYRRKCNNIGDLTSILYQEANSEIWGKHRNYGSKLIRGAKENLIKFFQYILTSVELKEINHLTPQFKEFHMALKSIENTKIFGKRSQRWALKMQRCLQNRNNKNSYGNPIQILSHNQNQVKIKRYINIKDNFINERCNNPKCNRYYTQCRYGDKSNSTVLNVQQMLNTKKNVMKKCKGCKLVFYCNKKCQKYDWNRFDHKKLCIEFRD